MPAVSVASFHIASNFSCSSSSSLYGERPVNTSGVRMTCAPLIACSWKMSTRCGTSGSASSLFARTSALRGSWPASTPYFLRAAASKANMPYRSPAFT